MDIQKQTSDYRSIVKSISIFGGVQIYQILITLMKAKVLALFIGVVGMGIAGLLTSTVAVITVIAGLGLKYGVVRELAQASHDEDLEKIDKIYTIFSRWLYLTSVIGVIFVILFSSQLSKLAFGNQNYTWAFIWLSITLLFDILTLRNNTLMQGTRKIQGLAKSTVVGSTFGLIISFPLYYYLGIKGIVPALILAAIASYAVSYFFVHKMSLSKISISVMQTIFAGKDIVKLGIVMVLALLMGRVVILGVNVFISHTGSLADVGLYTAGTAITSQSVGLVFRAISIDYFPRLSAISSDNAKVQKMVNQQSEITLLIILPLLIMMTLIAPILIKILLTSEFIKLTNFVRIVAFGTIFQAAAFTISYIPLAKGDKKTYFIWNACFNNLLGIALFTTGYKLYGLDGLAISLVLHHMVSFSVFMIVTRKLYNYKISKIFVYLLSVSVFMLGSVLLMTFYSPNIYGYSFGIFLLLVSVTFSIYNIDKLIDIKKSLSILTSKFKSHNFK